MGLFAEWFPMDDPKVANKPLERWLECLMAHFPKQKKGK
jgi:hypothetical protein